MIHVDPPTHRQGTAHELEVKYFKGKILKNPPRPQDFHSPAIIGHPALDIYLDLAAGRLDDLDGLGLFFGDEVPELLVNCQGYLSTGTSLGFHSATMKFSSPSSPTNTSFDSTPHPPSPLSALIPTFLRRPTASSSSARSSVARSRASSFIHAAPPELPPIRTSTAPPSPTPSSAALGLLDDDPFACHSKSPSAGWSEPSTPTLVLPPRPRRTTLNASTVSRDLELVRSRVYDQADEVAGSSSDAEIQPLHRRGRSLTTTSVHPRNQPWQSDKPAFRSRPSLPSLSTLAQQNVVIFAPRSSRATLFPVDPWDNTESLNVKIPVGLQRTASPPTSPPHTAVPSTSPRVSPTRDRKRLSPRIPPKTPGQVSPRSSLTPPPTPAKDIEAFHASLPPHPSPIEEEEEEESIPVIVAQPPESGLPEQDTPCGVSNIVVTVEKPSTDATLAEHNAADTLAQQVQTAQDLHASFDFYRISGYSGLSPSPSSCLLPSPRNSLASPRNSLASPRNSMASSPVTPTCDDEGCESGSDTEDMGCRTAETQSEVYFGTLPHDSSESCSTTEPPSPTLTQPRGRLTHKTAARDPGRLLQRAPSMFLGTSSVIITSPVKRAASHPPRRPRNTTNFIPPINMLSYADHDYYDSYFKGGDGNGSGSRRASGHASSRGGGGGRDRGVGGGAAGGGRDDEDDHHRRRWNSTGPQSSAAPSEADSDSDSSSDYGEPDPERPKKDDEERRRRLLSSASANRHGRKAPPVPPVPDHLRLPSPNPTSSVTSPTSGSGSRVPSWAAPPQPISRPRTQSTSATSSSLKTGRSSGALGPPSSTLSSSISPRRSVRTSEDSSEDSDNVPLAQRIPTALTAQKSIRQKARDQKSRRTGASTAARTSRPSTAGEETRVRSISASGVAPDELMMKLLKVQQGVAPPSDPVPATSLSRKQSQSNARPHQASPVIAHALPAQAKPVATAPPSSFQATSLRPSRSLHRLPNQSQPAAEPVPQRRDLSLGPRSERRPPPLEVSAAPPLPHTTVSRSGTQIRRRSPDALARSPMPKSPMTPAVGLPATGVAAVSMSRDTSQRAHAELVPPSRALDRPDSRRPSTERTPLPSPLPRPARHQTTDEHAHAGRTAESQLSRAKTTTDRGRSEKGETRDSGPKPPVPASARDDSVQQQRVFVGDLQSFRLVEINSSSRASDIIDMVLAQGDLEGSGWMLWELANEFGMERPIRDFELLSSVFATWNPEARLNALIMKRHPLTSVLSQRIPSSAPTFAGFVNWEVKRGKWSKRWLELREQSLFIGKKENSKDEAFLCSLSSFDAYLVRRITRAPKPYVFAVKSTDSIAFFENPSDCVHIFSCDAESGNTWIEKLLVNRSYILQQERNVLNRANTLSKQNQSPKGLSRSGTRSAAQSRPLLPSATSPVLPPLGFQQNQSLGGLFAEGSLLGKTSAA